MPSKKQFESGQKSTNAVLSKVKGFDAHCHIFNTKYALKEIKSMAWGAIKGEFRKEESFVKSSKKEHELIKEFRKKLFMLAECISVLREDEVHNFQFVQNETNNVWGIPIGAIPLTMDIYYIFAPPVEESDTEVYEPSNMTFDKGNINEMEFEKEFSENMLVFAENLKEKNKNISDFEIFAEELDLNILKLQNDNDYKSKTNCSIYGNLKMSNGFLYHLENLRGMVENEEPIFPFFAADPRRPGIFEALKNEKIISKNGPFYGVKLYPRLGYHPASKPVQDMLQICIDRDLPVISHAGFSGFPPKDFSFDGSGIWKYNEYGNPKYFESALKKGLRINFAHLGSSYENLDWAKIIVDFMEKYDNVYSDLSCYTNKKELDIIKKEYGNNTKFKERIMYGSDFDMIYFPKDRVTLNEYVHNFSEVFKDEIEDMRYKNVLNFMKF